MRKIILTLAALLCACGNTTSQSEEWVVAGTFTTGVEGPAIDTAGNLYAVNLARQGTIGMVTAKNQTQIFLQLPEGSTGNSLGFDRHGALYVADYTGHNILKYDPDSRELLQRFHNDRMHQPNDITIADNGTIYASDPDWKNGSGQLWKMDSSGNFTLLETDMGTTNGIELSPDGGRLYVNESVQRRVWVYDVLDNGTLDNKRLLVEFPDYGLDGMATDQQGNLYIARYGAGSIVVLSPEGKILREYTLGGAHPTNIVLSRDGSHAFVTMQKRGSIERIALKAR